MYYKINKYKQKGSFGIFNEVSKNFTLVHLMYSIGNVNHAIGVVGYWTFDSNYKKSLVLNRESLDIICSLYVVEEQVAKFETVFYAVRYIPLIAKLKKELSLYISQITD